MKKTILVIEPEAETRVFLRTLLFRHGFKVHGTGSEKEGEDLISRLNPDLVVLDALLLDEGAVTLLRNINEIPVVLISSIPLRSLYYRYRLTENSERRNAESLPFLEKPLQEDDLLGLINQLIRT